MHFASSDRNNLTFRTARRILAGLIVSSSFIFAPAAIAAGPPVVDVTTANAPAVLIADGGVTVFVPFGDDTTRKSKVAAAEIEPPTLGPAITPGKLPRLLPTGSVNSCAASGAQQILLCAGEFGPMSEFRLPSLKKSGFTTRQHKLARFTGGGCVNCGVALDDQLEMAFVSTAKGYVPVQLSPRKVLPVISTNGEAPSGNFGYDPVNHRIYSPNYLITDPKHFTSGPPHFQLIDVATSTPTVFELGDDNDFFHPTNAFCTGSDTVQHGRDTLPDSGAIDTVTNIAYVTFRSPSDCNNGNQSVDIGLLDMTQAQFTPASNNMPASWTTPAKQIVTLSELAKLPDSSLGYFANGITGISIVSPLHMAIIADRRELSGGTTGFGALLLPATSGSGTPNIADYVQAQMPNDPDGNSWTMSDEPNGVVGYLSPTSGKAMGIVMNGARTYVAVVDLAALLSATRQSGTQHTVATSVDLLNSGIVRFVKLRPSKGKS
jgi:hypothetical protein